MKKLLESMHDDEKLKLYINQFNPIINRKALFTDGTPFYRSYTDLGDGKYEIHLRFRTARNNVEYVEVVTKKDVIRMTKCASDDLFDYYEASMIYPACGKNYYYKIVSGAMTMYFNKRGTMADVQEYYSYNLKPDFKTPDWAKGAIFYQIFVDRFYNGDKSNDPLDNEYYYIDQYSRNEKDWSAYPDKMDVAHFYGGDLQGVWDKLDYLQDLGVEVLYLNPIFVSPSNHKYDAQDYDHIDPHYGVILHDEGDVLKAGDKDNSHATRYISRTTDPVNLRASDEFFIRLVEEIHRRGMKIILDGVFNHCGSFNKWMDKEGIYKTSGKYSDGAYTSATSQYRRYFNFRSEKWPDNADYEGWWNHLTLPKLNYEESPDLYNYILQVGRKWVSPPYNVDGWRLDVAADLGHTLDFNHQFWKDFRVAVREAKPDALILAENYTDPYTWLQGDEWDTIMNYEAFMDPVTWFFTGIDKHSDEYRGDLHGDFRAFEGAMSHHMSRMHYESIHTTMNELSNHDHSRFLTRTNGKVGRIASLGAKAAEEGVNKAVMREAVVVQMTWPGAPTVYYGDEAGLCGWTDPDDRRTYPWGHEDHEMIAFHKEVIRIHRESSALRTGSHKMLHGELGILSFGRFDANGKYVTICNNKKVSAKVTIPVWQIGIASGKEVEQLIFTDETGFNTLPKYFTIQNGCLTIELPAKSSVILRERQ